MFITENTLSSSGGGGTDATITITDITTNNVSTVKHGFFPKLPNPTGKFLRDDASWQSVSTGSNSFWTLLPLNAIIISTTQFTYPNDLSNFFKKGLILQWQETGIYKNAFVVNSSFASNLTVNICGDSMASIDSSSLKYCNIGIESFTYRFAMAGNISAIVTDAMNSLNINEPSRVLGGEMQAGTIGTTNNTTVNVVCGRGAQRILNPTLSTDRVSSIPTPPYSSAIDLQLNDRIQVDIVAVQTTPAIDLYVQLYLFPSRYNLLP